MFQNKLQVVKVDVEHFWCLVQMHPFCLHRITQCVSRVRLPACFLRAFLFLNHKLAAFAKSGARLMTASKRGLAVEVGLDRPKQGNGRMLKGNNGRMLKGNSEKTQSCSFCFPSRLHMFQTVCYLSGMFPSVSLVPHGIQCQVPWKNEHVAEISAVIFTTLLAAFSSF